MSLFKEEESLSNYEEYEWLFWRWMEEAAYKEDMRDPSLREDESFASVCASAHIGDTDYSDLPF